MQRTSTLTRKLSVIWSFRVLYAMLLPGLIYYAVYRYSPMFGAIIAFKNFNVMLGVFDSPWASPGTHISKRFMIHRTSSLC